MNLITKVFVARFYIFRAVNAALRSENREMLKSWFSYLKLFLTALYKLPSQIVVVWRGVRNVDLRPKYPIEKNFVYTMFYIDEMFV
jgi:hypothetical protein